MTRPHGFFGVIACAGALRAFLGTPLISAAAVPMLTIEPTSALFDYIEVRQSVGVSFEVNLWQLNDKNMEVPVPARDVIQQVYTLDSDVGGDIRSVRIGRQIGDETGDMVGGFRLAFSDSRRVATLTSMTGNNKASFEVVIVVRYATLGRKLFDFSGKVKVKGSPELFAFAQVQLDVFRVTVDPVTSNTDMQVGRNASPLNVIANPSGIVALLANGSRTRGLALALNER